MLIEKGILQHQDLQKNWKIYSFGKYDAALRAYRNDYKEPIKIVRTRKVLVDYAISEYDDIQKGEVYKVAIKRPSFSSVLRMIAVITGKKVMNIKLLETSMGVNGISPHVNSSPHPQTPFGNGRR